MIANTLVSMIVCTGRDRSIGKDNKLVWNVPRDLQHFKRQTMGHVIVMGRKTFESLPGLLPGRHHRVISRQLRQSDIPMVSYYTSLEAALTPSPSGEIWIIGGAEIYEQALPFIDRLFITEVDGEYPSADTYFPEYRQTVKFPFKRILWKGPCVTSYCLAKLPRHLHQHGELSWSLACHLDNHVSLIDCPPCFQQASFGEKTTPSVPDSKPTNIFGLVRPKR